MNSTSFLHYLFLKTKRNREIIDFDFDSFRIIGFKSKDYKAFLNNNPLKYEDTDHWIYGKCNIDTDGKDIKDLIEIGEFSKSACIKKYYNHKNKTYFGANDKNFVPPELSYGMSNDNYSFYPSLLKNAKMMI